MILQHHYTRFGRIVDLSAGFPLRARISGGVAGAPRPQQPNSMSNVDLVENLCSVSAPLREARRVHVKAYGNLVPDVFMSDVLRRVGQCLGLISLALHRHEMDGILAALERGMTEGDRETRNVIAMSFTRDSELEPFFAVLRPLLGPRTRAQLHGK